MKWFCYIFLACYPLCCWATLFSSVPIENIDGGVKLNFTLSAGIIIQDGNQYIFFAECEPIGYNDGTASNSSSEPNSLTCAAIEYTNLQGCCDNCVANGSSEGTIFVEGPLSAGELYECSLFGFVHTGVPVFGGFETENFTALTGLPSLPGFEITVDDDGILYITVGSEFDGGDADLIYRVRVTDEYDDIVYETNSTTMNIIISGLENGEYNITIWAINTYGASDNITDTVTIDVIDFASSIAVTSAVNTATVTVETTSTVESTGSSDTNIGAIVGGVVGGVVVLVAVVAAISIAVIVLIVKKNKNGRRIKTMKVIPIE